MNKNALKYTLVSLLTAAPFFFLSATVGFVVLGLALAYSISKPGMSKRLNALFFAGFVATMIAGTGWIGGVALGLIGLLCSRMFVAAEAMEPGCSTSARSCPDAPSRLQRASRAAG